MMAGTGSDQKTGTPDISISSGVATLTVAQTGNIGQGCRITYGGHICYISQVNSSTSFNVVDEHGVAAADHASIAVDSILYEYGTLSAAEAGATDGEHLANTNLTSVDKILNIVCYYDPVDNTADVTALSISEYPTDATRYINIYTTSLP